MSGQLQIDQMTVLGKLRIMEELWENLRTRAEDVSLPKWQKDLLDERQVLIETGEAEFSDWETAKKRITKLTGEHCK